MGTRIFKVGETGEGGNYRWPIACQLGICVICVGELGTEGDNEKL